MYVNSEIVYANYIHSCGVITPGTKITKVFLNFTQIMSDTP